MPRQSCNPETLQAAALSSRQRGEAVYRCVATTALRIDCGDAGRFVVPPIDLLQSYPNLRLLELMGISPIDADKQTSITYLACKQDVQHFDGEPPSSCILVLMYVHT